jgi:cbb3-type cytochrome oxidase maturation protein
MTDFLYLIPVALVLGAAGLGAFLWSLHSGQYDDLDGAAERILHDDDVPLKIAGQKHPPEAAASETARSSGISARGPGADN